MRTCLRTATGAKTDALLSTLTPAQIDVLKETIRIHEGWRSRTRETSPPVDGVAGRPTG